jgi:hypothetical protein
MGVSGIATNLVREFTEGKTARAVAAFGPVGTVRLIAVDPMLDVEFSKKAIQFAIDNSTGIEKAGLGGPIDVAILRKGQGIEWVGRKNLCYQMDAH